MKHTILLATGLAFLIGAITGYAVHGLTKYDGHHGMETYGRYDDHHSDRDGMPMRMSMGGDHAGHGMGEHNMHMDMMVKSERGFIEHMIPHHEEAVSTAKEVLARGGSTPEIRTLAENIITAQEREIADMKQWYESWYGTPYADKGIYEPMMRDLSILSGTELDKVFLEDMVHHHMGAIMMARSVEPFIEHEEMRTLTETIIRTQSAEIEAMQSLRAGLK